MEINQTLIFGHKNPDTDSIMSSMVMANLENQLGNTSKAVLMATKNRKEIIKAFQTHAVDTTGAGDSFWGGVLCSILSINKPVEKMEWEEIRNCAVLGNAVAGLCVQKRGGIPAIPTKEAVFEFMQK